MLPKNIIDKEKQPLFDRELPVFARLDSPPSGHILFSAWTPPYGTYGTHFLLVHQQCIVDLTQNGCRDITTAVAARSVPSIYVFNFGHHF